MATPPTLPAPLAPLAESSPSAENDVQDPGPLSRSTTLSARRRGEIAACAARVAEELRAEGRIEPEAVAEHAGLAFHYAPFLEEFDGALIPTESGHCVILNARRAARGSPRSRFAFAHELGHYLLPEHRAALTSGALPPHLSGGERGGGHPFEREADHFAAHLLMPSARFAAAATGLAPGTAQVVALAEQFGTSLSATAFRALELDLWPAPAAVFHWAPLGRRAGRKASPATFALSPDYDGLIEEIPADSATAQAAGRLRVGIEARNTDALTWFPQLGAADHPENVPLREEVMSIGHYGWLTFVYRAAAGQD